MGGGDLVVGLLEEEQLLTDQRRIVALLMAVLHLRHEPRHHRVDGSEMTLFQTAKCCMRDQPDELFCLCMRNCSTHGWMPTATCMVARAASPPNERSSTDGRGVAPFIEAELLHSWKRSCSTHGCKLLHECGAVPLMDPSFCTHGRENCSTRGSGDGEAAPLMEGAAPLIKAEMIHSCEVDPCRYAEIVHLMDEKWSNLNYAVLFVDVVWYYLLRCEISVMVRLRRAALSVPNHSSVTLSVSAW